ncbi:MAG TPA: hypothetical protein DGM68_09940 [Bacteroides fragilis]|nr:hypothetical protein [Bacteroides fragilis]
MEYKWPQNSIFRQDRHLVINNIHPERWKIENHFSGSSSNLVVNSLFLYFQVDNCPFCLL